MGAAEPAAHARILRGGISAIVWSGGFRADYRWIEVPVFDGSGYPRHQRGVTAAQGCTFSACRGSIPGDWAASVAWADADYLAEHIGGARRRPRSRPALNERALGA